MRKSAEAHPRSSTGILLPTSVVSALGLGTSAPKMRLQARGRVVVDAHPPERAPDEFSQLRDQG
jgi:hypothetical protein